MSRAANVISLLTPGNSSVLRAFQMTGKSLSITVAGNDCDALDSRKSESNLANVN